MGRPREPEFCYFCGESNLNCIELHHVIPNSLWVYVDLSNMDEVWLCANCHIKLHKLLGPIFAFIKKTHVKSRVEAAGDAKKQTTE